MASVASYPDETGNMKTLLFTCTSSGAGASTGTSVKRIRGVVYRVIIDPGADVSANYTVALLDENSVDILQSDGNTGIICSSATATVELRPATAVCDIITCTIAGLGSAKTCTVLLYYTGA